MTMRGVLIVASALALPMAALAQDVDCNNQQTQYALNVCSSAAAQRSDGELNQVWGQIKPRADGEGWGGALLNEQRAWIATRNARCESVRASFGQGSMAPAAYYMCIDDMTRARIAMLKSLF